MLVTNGEEEEDRAGGSFRSCEWVLEAVSLLTDRGRGLEWVSRGATLRAIGCNCLLLGAPPVACWTMSWW